MRTEDLNRLQESHINKQAQQARDKLRGKITPTDSSSALHPFSQTEKSNLSGGFPPAGFLRGLIFVAPPFLAVAFYVQKTRALAKISKKVPPRR